MAFDREAAKQAGYTDDEINAYLQAEAAKQQAPAPVVQDVGEPPAPTTVINEVTPTAASMGTTSVMAAAPYVVPAAIGAGSVYGANLLKQGIGALNANAAAKLASEQGIQGRFEGRLPAAPVTAPVAPTMTAPPVAQAARVVEQPGVMQRGADIASKMRQFAASKVIGPAGEALGAAGKALAPLAPVGRVLAGPIGTGAQALFHSGSTGPQVPMQGPFRGMEINPNTGRPWTPQELAQINGR